MIDNYLRVLKRYFFKYKLQFSIAIFGLSFGLICLIPALYWMDYEISFDNFYPKADQIYRVYSIEKQSGKVNERVPGILGEELKKQFREIETVTDFVIEQIDYQTENEDYASLKTICVDSTFFQIFPQKGICGDIQQSLQTSGNMVLTESAAIRLFGNVEKALGQRLENELSRIFGSCLITAVVKDPPQNTNLPFDAILNFPAIQDASMIMPVKEQWNYFNNEMYIKVHSLLDVENLALQMSNFTTLLEVNSEAELRILPISDIRYKLNADLPFTLNFIWLLIIAGVLLVFSSLFNFLSLHITFFYQRIPEFRIRVVYGARSKQLIRQMMFELIFSFFFALLLAYILLFAISPLFSDILGINISKKQLLYYFIVCGFGIIALIVSTSLYPCWQLVRTINSSLSYKKTTKQPVLQRIAVLLQLSVSIMLIISVSVIIMQVHFVNQKDLGFDKQGIIQLYSADAVKLESHQEVIKRQLTTMPQVLSVSTTTFEPAQSFSPQNMTSEVFWEGKQSQDKTIFQWIFTDDKFAETFQLKILQGEWWREGEKDIKKIVLNEEAVRVMGLNNPVGTIIYMNPSTISNEGISSVEKYEIIGVVNNFHSLSLRNRIYPTIFRQPTNMGNCWYIRVTKEQEQEVIQRISAILPNIDMSLTNVRLTCLDDLYNQLNYSEQTGLKLFSVLAVVSFFISLFGVYAVATTTSQRRRKEIAIRKIVGAELIDIIKIFLREYMLLVAISSIVAFPLAYYAMRQWLQNYAYRINISVWLLVLIFIVVTVVVLFTVLFQILKAANSDPAKVVKNGS